MAISQAQIQKTLMTIAVVFAAMYVVANYSSQNTCDMLGLTYKGA